MLTKMEGALVGFAIGDALGGTTEFLTKEEIQTQYGQLQEISGGGVWSLEKGETTDDTAMTIAVAKGILKNPRDPIEAIGNEFLKWYRSHPKDIGIIVRTVLGSFNGNWFETAKKAHFEYLDELSAGNGTLMRCLPAALAYKDLDEIEAVTRKQSKMTHYDSKADDACFLYNRIAYRVLQGAELKETISAEVKGTIYESVLNGQRPTCLPSGYVVDTMNWVLYWLLHAETFTDVVVGAANEGHDSDTVAAIAGGLAGMACGFEGLPRKYVDVLLQKEELIELARELKNLRTR
ncbi:ADP-ribosylglycohydrolase family protein [Neobacillus vireti]|uniref:ADP-ribosylglycohydrolase family protein n=1 Tax=Neobacillus vireti TaxID=220686 RepID=UPI002FFE1AA9